MQEKSEVLSGFSCPKEQQNQRCTRLDALADEYDAVAQQHQTNLVALREAAQREKTRLNY